MFKKILFSIAVLALALPATALAQVNVDQVDPYTGDFAGLINTVISWVLGVVVLLAVGLIIWGGVQMMTARGDSEKFSQAQNVVIYAIIGLIVAFVAWALVRWVLGSVLGTTV